MLKEFENELENLINKHKVPNVIIAYTDVDTADKLNGDIGTFTKGKLKSILFESLMERIGVNNFSGN